jgi:hypothetical protein
VLVPPDASSEDDAILAMVREGLAHWGGHGAVERGI